MDSNKTRQWRSKKNITRNQFMEENKNLERQQSAENIPEEIISEQSIENDQKQTENMETHANHLHKAPGHGLKHYFFEFFMLFLAVSLGFFLETAASSVFCGEPTGRYCGKKESTPVFAKHAAGCTKEHGKPGFADAPGPANNCQPRLAGAVAAGRQLFN